MSEAQTTDPGTRPEFSRRAHGIFLGIQTIRTDSGIVVQLHESGNPTPVFEDVKKRALIGVSNLACIVSMGDALRNQLTDDLNHQIAVACWPKDRPEILPQDKLSCSQMAIKLFVNVVSNFRTEMLDRELYDLPIDALFSPDEIDELHASMQRIDDDDDAFLEVLRALVASVDATGFSCDQLRTFAGLASREGAAWSTRFGDASDNPSDWVLMTKKEAGPKFDTTFKTLKRRADAGTFRMKEVPESRKVLIHKSELEKISSATGQQPDRN